jgi:hypothetical protein
MRYINALVDPRYRKTYQRVKLFMTNPYKLSIIKQMRQMVLLLSFLICLQYTESKFQILWEINNCINPISYDQQLLLSKGIRAI